MGLNDTPNANRIHIGIFGKRNAGKSSIVNAITGQDLAVVSDVKGTTTDPVYKAMELLPLGPVMMIDTPGIDDEGELGELRVRKSRQVLNKTDIALVIIDALEGKTKEDEELLYVIKEKDIPCLVVWNKADLLTEEELRRQQTSDDALLMNGQESGQAAAFAIPVSEIAVSTRNNWNIEELKNRIGRLAQVEDTKFKIIGDRLQPSDFAVLVVPIDKAAPKGRLILPQQQTIRDILEADATAIVVKEFELKDTLQSLGKKPSIVITDSQVFAKVSADTPADIHLTSFSILMARSKGVLRTAVKGAAALDTLKEGDEILISEGCTHHRQCDDIGTVKLPRWIRNYTGKNFDFQFTSGTEFPEDVTRYKLIVHCGGCTLNDREMKYRQKCAEDMKVPFTNYGILIAFMQGILKRSVAIFPEILMELEE